MMQSFDGVTDDDTQETLARSDVQTKDLTAEMRIRLTLLADGEFRQHFLVKRVHHKVLGRKVVLRNPYHIIKLCMEAHCRSAAWQGAGCLFTMPEGSAEKHMRCGTVVGRCG
jgi:hypothetical protein